MNETQALYLNILRLSLFRMDHIVMGKEHYEVFDYNFIERTLFQHFGMYVIMFSIN